MSCYFNNEEFIYYSSLKVLFYCFINWCYVFKKKNYWNLRINYITRYLDVDVAYLYEIQLCTGIHQPIMVKWHCCRHNPQSFSDIHVKSKWNKLLYQNIVIILLIFHYVQYKNDLIYFADSLKIALNRPIPCQKLHQFMEVQNNTRNFTLVSIQNNI